MKVGLSVVLALALTLQAGSVKASAVWAVDDTCAKSHTGTFFWLGGPLTGWTIHSGSGVNGCHLFNWTEGSALPVNWANYALPIDEGFNGLYTIRAYIACHHNAPNYKYYVFANGTAGGVTSIHTTGTHMLPCDQTNQVVPGRNFCAVCGGSIRLVDNVPVAAEPQNADRHIFQP